MMEKEAFIEECQFAKVVETANGEAILIAGMVFEISGSPEARFHVSSIVSALRQSGKEAANVGSSEG